MKVSRKLLCALLAAALLILSVAPAYAVTVDTKDTTIYLGSKDGSTTYTYSLNLYDLPAGAKITDIKSSNRNVIGIHRLRTTDTVQKYFESTQDDQKDHEASIEVRGLKKGSATVSFKVNGTAYKKKFTVLDYVNPIKSIQVTGTSNANLKTKFAKGDSGSCKLTSNAKAGYVKVSAASGWKIMDLEWSQHNNDYNSRYFYYSEGVSSAKLPVPAMSKSGHYFVWLALVNTKTNGMLSLGLYLGND